MTYSVVVEPAAKRQFDKLPEQVQQRLAEVIDRLTRDPRPRGTKKIKGFPDSWRARVGNYRILYRVDDKVVTIYVFEIGDRRDCYRRRD